MRALRTTFETADRIVDIEGLIEQAQRRVAPRRTWKLISSRTKLAKKLFEVEENGRRLIGKVSDSEKAQGAYGILTQLWKAGLQPPSIYTVVEPIAYLPDMHLLIQEKAPGVQLIELIQTSDPAAEVSVREAACWLARLHDTVVPFHAGPDILAPLDRIEGELSRAVPASAARIRAIAAALRKTDPPRVLVPSHGDFHPMNVFIAPGRVTVIDLDTFAGREAAYDVAYFLAQTSIMGHLTLGSFEATQRLRDAFLDSYSQAASWRPNRQRIGTYCALAFLRGLHYEICILRTGNEEVIEPWISEAERNVS